MLFSRETPLAPVGRLSLPMSDKVDACLRLEVLMLADKCSRPVSGLLYAHFESDLMT
jgi:hypothetical protein